jgi:hypothetical protein
MRRPALALAGSAVVLAVALLVGYLTVGRGSARSASATAAAPASAGVAGSGGVATAAAAGPAGASAHPSVPAGSPGPPQPFIQAFAQQSGAPRVTAKPVPTGKLTIPANIDGCDHDYGGIGLCVPWTFPAGVTDRCAWLRAQGFGPVPVTGTDRLGLDTNHDRVACDPGDAP